MKLKDYSAKSSHTNEGDFIKENEKKERKHALDKEHDQEKRKFLGEKYQSILLSTS